MKVTLQQQRDFYSDFMGEELCPDQKEVSKEELDEAILDCQSMLRYSIDLNNKEEVNIFDFIRKE